MKMLLGILTLTAMVFSLNSLVFAAELTTPLAFGTGFDCVAFNMGNKKIEIEVAYCHEVSGTMSCYEDPPKTIAPGEKFTLSKGIVCKGCYAICYFSFKGGADEVSAGIENGTLTGDIVLIPAK